MSPDCAAGGGYSGRGEWAAQGSIGSGSDRDDYCATGSRCVRASSCDAQTLVTSDHIKQDASVRMRPVLIYYVISHLLFCLSLRKEILHGIVQMLGGKLQPIAGVHKFRKLLFIAGYIVNSSGD